MIGLLKAVLDLFGALAGYFRDRQLVNAGKAEAQHETDTETLDMVEFVHVPITDDERERVWNELKARRKPVARVSCDPGTRLGRPD